MSSKIHHDPVLVTGGAGFIGSHTCETLLKKGYQVYTIDNFDSFYPVERKKENIRTLEKYPNFRFYEADLRNKEETIRVLSPLSFKTIVHLASRGGMNASVDDPLYYLDEVLKVTINLFEAVKNKGIKLFINASSSSVYGINKKTPFKEGDLAEFQTAPYAALKRSSEHLCFTYHYLYHIPVVNIRMFSVYGPRGRPDQIIYKFAQMITDRKPIPWFKPVPMRDFTYIDDIVGGIVKIIEKNSWQYETINLGFSRGRSLADVVRLLEKSLGAKAKFQVAGTAPRSDFPKTIADITRAKNLLDYSPEIPLEKGIAKFVEWFQNQKRKETIIPKTRKEISISVVGLGYIGSVAVGALSSLGYKVWGIGRGGQTMRILEKGMAPVFEKGLDELIAEGYRKKRIKVTDSYETGIENSEITFVCVGTPVIADGGLDLSQSLSVARSIGLALQKKKSFHTIIFRSTMFPGTVEDVLIPIIESFSGKKQGIDFDILYHPEFLREGQALDDFFHPPFTIIGGHNSSGIELLKKVYGYDSSNNSLAITAPLFTTSIKEAEMIKYTCNAFHANKVAFANEIGDICKRYHIDGFKVMEIFVQDTKLNISPKYLSPGSAYGGSCLSKDLQVLVTQAKIKGLTVPLLSSVEESNSIHRNICLSYIKSFGRKKIAVLGLAFKEDTDDIRDSQPLLLILDLINEGYDVSVYDPVVAGSMRLGRLRDVFREYPKIKMVSEDDLSQALSNSEIVVITGKQTNVDILKNLVNPHQIIIDLVGQFHGSSSFYEYEGIAW